MRHHHENHESNSKDRQIFFTADTHFFYDQILETAHRSFKDIEEMNKKISDNINSRCTESDILYIVGDVACYGCDTTALVALLKSIKPELRLIAGNHDRALLNSKRFCSCFSKISSHEYLTVGGYDLYLSHYPLAEWDGLWKGRWLFYGHVHEGLAGPAVLMDRMVPTAVNVGADVNDFMPKTAEELISARKKNFSYPKQDEMADVMSAIIPVADGRNKLNDKSLDLSWVR